MTKIPSAIHIYTEGIGSYPDINLLVHYLRKKVGIQVDLREDLFQNILTKPESVKRELAKEIAIARVIDVNKEVRNLDPLPIEIEYEYRHIVGGKRSIGLLYDGFYLQEIYARLLPDNEHNLAHAHIIFTSRLLGTFEDNRYHVRVAVFGAPTFISTSGIVEGPAKPREFYLKKQLGQNVAILKEEFKGRFIDYDDPRMTEVMKGYLMQAFFYYAFGNPFCDDPNCKLYNAHWQEEVIHAQLESKYEFCEKHTEALHKWIMK